MKTDLEDDLAAEPNPVEEILETATEEERWDPVLGSQGERKPALYGDDDDDEDGRAPGAMLVESGVEAAEYDQMLQSDKADPAADDEDEDVDTEDEPLKLPDDEVSEADADKLEEDEP
jgi:hypothetical protein